MIELIIIIYLLMIILGFLFGYYCLGSFFEELGGFFK